MAQHMEPDLGRALPAPLLNFIQNAAAALENAAPHGSIMLGDVPVEWEGEVVGFLVLSEIDGQTWDYCPAVEATR